MFEDKKMMGLRIKKHKPLLQKSAWSYLSVCK
jgi:hypothetical protein